MPVSKFLHTSLFILHYPYLCALLMEESTDRSTNLSQCPTPSEIVQELDKYIIGQQDAKKHVAIALRNRWRRLSVPESFRQEIVPNNILLIGSTGVGKTEIARRLAKIANAPFTKVEASKFTEVGYVGRDVESMVRDLVEQSVHMVKVRKKDEVKAKAIQNVEDIILDALIPPIKAGTGEESSATDDEDLNMRTRERFREKIRTGELDERKIEVSVQSSGGGMEGGFIGGGPMDEMSLMNIQEVLGNLGGKKGKKRRITIKEAKKVLLEEEAGKLIDMDEVKEEAVFLAENSGIIFIDEIDKIASSSKGSGPDVSREGVQRDLLPIVEGSTVNTKYGVVRTDHILFISAGAFHQTKPSDLIPELQGRFPIRVELQSLRKEDFLKILMEPHNALTKQYTAMLEAEGVGVEFQKDALERVAEIAFQVNEQVENIGARRLHTVMSTLLNDILYRVPDDIKPGTQLKIDAAFVQNTLGSLVTNVELSRFIL